VQLLELGDHVADELVRICDHVGEMGHIPHALVAFGREIVGAVRRGVVRRMREHHWVIEEKGAVFFAGEKIERVIADDIGSVFVAGVVAELTVDLESGIFISARPARELPEAVFIEAKVRRTFKAVTQLPFAGDARGVTGVLEQVGKSLLRWIEMGEVRVVAPVA
jgi:hypothetical protein